MGKDSSANDSTIDKPIAPDSEEWERVELLEEEEEEEKSAVDADEKRSEIDKTSEEESETSDDEMAAEGSDHGHKTLMEEIGESQPFIEASLRSDADFTQRDGSRDGSGNSN